MRRVLVASVAIGLVLILPAPAQAYHLYLKIKAQGGTTYVETDCPVNRTLTVEYNGLKQSLKVPTGTFRGTDAGLSRAGRTKLNRIAGGGENVVATCNAPSDHDELEVLPFTGVTTAQQLGLGLGLIGIGVALLLWLGPARSRRPRRKRPPVRVYAQ
jgi:hypothetical protein